MSNITWLPNPHFSQYILNIARATLQHGGVTADVSSQTLLAPVDAWYFPKYPAKALILPSTVDLCPALKQFIIANSNHWSEPNTWLGTWINPQTREYYLDITTSRQDLDEARQEAIALGLKDGRNIVAIYNPARQQTVYL